MEYRQALKIIGNLSKPSKMPWFAWSISADRCNVGSKLRKHEGTVCSKCYAHKGFYNMPVVKNALERRYHALQHPKFVEAFVVVLAHNYAKSKNTYQVNLSNKKENRFRWLDAGDLQDMNHLQKIVDIAELTPYIRHWLPTKEYALIRKFKEIGGSIPHNLSIKISMPKINQSIVATWNHAQVSY